MLSKSSLKPQAQTFFFFTTGINKLVSHRPKCVDWNGSFLTTKGVFEPS